MLMYQFPEIETAMRDTIGDGASKITVDREALAGLLLAAHGQVPQGETLVPVSVARPLLGRPGRPLARHTVLSLGLRREIDVREVCGRFAVTQSSIDAYRARNGLG